MNYASITKSVNQTLEVFRICVEKFVSVALHTTLHIKNDIKFATSSWSYPIELSELQVTLIKVLLILILGTVVLIAYSWKIYGQVITEKFVRPSTIKEIEELKLSVAKLKLPKDHSPRL